MTNDEKSSIQNINKSDYDLLKNSKFFNEEYYKTHNPLIPNNVNLLEHFLTIGWKENYVSSKYFDTEYYLKYNPDVKKANINPLLHYLKHGKQEYRNNHWCKLKDSEIEPKLLDDYLTIYNSKWFDCEWYLENNPVTNKEIDPILHYLTEGHLENYDPDPLFSNEDYLKHEDVKKAKFNPLIHYLKYGEQENRTIFTSKQYAKTLTKNYGQTQILNIYSKIQSKIQIILPVLNNNDKYLKKCIETIIINTKTKYELQIFDCSTNNTNILKEFENISNINIQYNIKKDHLIKSINNIIKNKTTDIVFLDTNTIVTQKWLTNLIKASYKTPGILTPLSYEINQDILENNYSEDNINKIAYKIQNQSKQNVIQVPIIQSNVIYLKRNIINKIGLPTENKSYFEALIDYSLKISNKYPIYMSDNVLIYQKTNIKQIISNNKEFLRKEKENIQNINFDQNILNNLKQELKQHNENTIKPNLMYVTKRSTKKRILELTEYSTINHYFNVFILTVDDNNFMIWVKKHNKVSLLYQKREKKITNSQEFDVYPRIFIKYNIDAILMKKYPLEQESGNALYTNIATSMNIPYIYETDIKENITSIKEKIFFEYYTNKTGLYSNQINFKKNKIVIYTVNLNLKNKLNTPNYIDKNIDYICFSDKDILTPYPWTIKKIKNENQKETEIINDYKLFPQKYLKGYDYAIWIDPSILITQDIKKFINNYYTDTGLLITHNKDTNIIKSQIILQDLHNNQTKTLMEKVKKFNIVIKETENEDIKEEKKFDYNKYNFDSIYFDAKRDGYFRKNRKSFVNTVYTPENIDAYLNAMNKKVSVIIPIYNAFEETKNCIESVLQNTKSKYELILINDCSTDERIKPYLDSLNSKYDHIIVIHNTTNKGFIKNVNIGIKTAEEDVILLNSDTLVTKYWIKKLSIAAYSDKKIGSVTPVSNNAGAFSVPYINQKNEIDPKKGLEKTANIIEKISENKYLQVPTGNGFCMYIKRAAIYDVGFFDEIFGKGYCEENDFCMRLNNKGWKNIIDESTYIYHIHNVSFSDEKNELIKKNRKILNKKHPTYTIKAKKMIMSSEYEQLRKNIEYNLNNLSERINKPRLLYVLHEGSGGTLHTSIELASQTKNKYEIFILTNINGHMKLWIYNENKNKKISSNKDDSFLKKITKIQEWEIKEKYNLTQESLNEYEHIYYNILLSLKIDIIHIRHLIRHTFDLPKIANKLGIPIVLSFHDFYYICPSHFLIDDKQTYCGGNCSNITSYDVTNKTKNKGQCEISKGLGLPLLKSFVHTWHKRVEKLFDMCDVFVTTSNEAKRIYIEQYPQLKNKEFKVIEHGRDLKTPNNPLKYVEIPEKNKNIKIIFPGHLNFHKGSKLIEEIKKQDIHSKLEYHYMGAIPKDSKLKEMGENYGFYNRNDFNKIVHKIKPSFIGILSIWPETYCHTLTESWSAGIPVLTIDIGALGERIKANGGGWFLSENPEKAYKEIIKICENKENYIQVVNQIKDIQFKTISQMSEEYMNIYKKLLE